MLSVSVSLHPWVWVVLGGGLGGAVVGHSLVHWGPASRQVVFRLHPVSELCWLGKLATESLVCAAQVTDCMQSVTVFHLSASDRDWPGAGWPRSMLPALSACCFNKQPSAAQPTVCCLTLIALLTTHRLAGLAVFG